MIRATTSTFCKRIVAIVIVFFCAPWNTQAQNITSIVGQVVDATTRKPVPYASVFIDRTTFGVTADSTGNFQLNVPDNYKILGVSSVGYKIKTLPLDLRGKKKYEIAIRLEPDLKLLNEVVIHGKKDKRTSVLP